MAMNFQDHVSIGHYFPVQTWMDLHRNILRMGIKQEVMDPLNIRCHHIHGQPLLSTTFNGIFMVDYLNILNIN